MLSHEFLYELLFSIECIFKPTLWESGWFEGFSWKDKVNRTCLVLV